jgi:KUP system potassium uptake protein
LTQQAVQLGYLPRLRIVHTNPDIRGQIYMPQVNFLLMVACIALVISFETSSNLAAACKKGSSPA